MLSFKKMHWIFWIFVVLFLIITFWSVGIWWYAKSIETPAYTVVKKYEHFEIREYEPILVAQVQEQGLNNGFMLLADYIFGDNSLQSSISMTTPVIDSEKSQPIAMTTPVIDTEKN